MATTISELPVGVALGGAVVAADNPAGTATQKITLADIAALGGGIPAAHKSRHATGGTDALTPADIGAAASTHTHSAADLTSGTMSDARLSANVVLTTDSRLSDARTPTAHTHSAADLTSGTLADARLSANVVLTGDARLSNARTPTSHKSTHATGGSDVLTPADIGAASSTHTHSAADLTSGTLADARLSANVPLLVGGLLPSNILPSFVDDVLEYTTQASFPATGSTGIIYVDTTARKIFRWSGSVYIEISPSPGSTTDVPEGANLYHTTARAAAAAPVQSVAGKTGAVSLTANDIGAASSTHTHSAADLTSGTLADARLSANVVLTNDVRLSNARTPTAHTHSLSDLTQSSATTGQVPTWNGTAWAPATPSAGGGGGAVSSVAGRTGDVVLTASDVGLGNVNNTSDANKPVSTAQAAADAAVQSFAIQRANHTGTQAASTITGLAAVATSGSYSDLTNKPAIPGLALQFAIF